MKKFWESDGRKIKMFSELLDGLLCYVPPKRSILRVIAGIYDLIGFIQPLIVKFKIYFQEVCLTNFGWDHNIPENLDKKWFNIIHYVNQNETVQNDPFA